MTFFKRMFQKRRKVQTASRIGGVFFFLLAAVSQILFGYFFIRNNAQGFPTRAEAVARVAEETGLPRDLVDLYTESLLLDGSTLLIAPIGAQTKIPFEPLEGAALTWGGKNPFFRLLIDGEEFTFGTEQGVIEAVVGAELETTVSPEPPLQVELSVPPIDWTDSLPRLHDREPYIMITVTDASSGIMHTPLPAYASVDLVYAKTKPSNPSTFTNKSLFVSREFEVVIVSETDGTLLEQSEDILARADASLGNALGELAFIELLVLVLFFFALGVYKGGLE